MKMKPFITELEDGLKVLVVPLAITKHLDEADVFALYLEAYTAEYGPTDLEIITEEFEKTKHWNKK